MKKLIIIYSALIIAIVVFAITQRGNFGFLQFGQSAQATINTKTYNVTVAKTDKDKMKGLSGRGSLNKNSGMLFVFDQKQAYSFWMKDMKFPIDILYIDDTKIVDIIENVPAPKDSKDTASLPVYRPKQVANYVLELNAGQAKENNIKIGDTVTFKNVQ